MSFDPPPLPPVQPPWPSFQVWWQQVLGNLKETVDGLQTAIDALAAAVAAEAAAVAAQTTANTAVTNAATAQTAADTVKRNDAITASYTAPGTTLTASDAGANATISIAAHTRVYGDISNVAVNSGSITGLAYSTAYFVYYDDPTRVGGAVTYLADTNSNHALPNKAVGRHYVGTVTTPAAGGGATSGGTAPPSGGGGVNQGDIHSTL